MSGLLERRHDVGLYEPRSIARNLVSGCKVTMKKEDCTLIAQKRSRRITRVTLVVSCRGAEARSLRVVGYF